MGMIWVGYRRDEAAARELLEGPDGIDELLESDDDVASVDLDKAWHGLHWLLSQDDTACEEAILGGEEIGEDLGYGPGRLLGPGDVKLVAAALAGLEPGELRARLDPAAMMQEQIYPTIWLEPDIFDGYLLPAFLRLRTFYAAAAAADEAVIQTLC